MRRLLVLIAAAASLPLAASTVSATASGRATRTAVVHIARPAAGGAMSQSNNWSGYNQGLLEKGTTFHEVSATWTVPAAKQHKAGQAEYSATWVGIGGGCLDTSCTLTDSTLIQAGTEQDVDSSGRPSYSAWWEIIPLPSLTVSLPVKAGQVVHVDVAETLPEVWTITIANLTTGGRFATTVPYTSSYATAEWIVETPLLIGTNGAGLSAMPSLSNVVFDPGTVNGGSPKLAAAERIQLVDTSGHVLATPSLPDSDVDGFTDCTYTTSCPVNAS